jgi:large subunit ribosomal protein L29
MKAANLRERNEKELGELEKSLSGDIFRARFKNFTNQLDDTSAVKKAKRDLARVKTVMTEKARAAKAEETKK